MTIFFTKKSTKAYTFGLKCFYYEPIRLDKKHPVLSNKM